MLYPEEEVTTLWRMYNKLSSFVLFVSLMYYIENRWTLFLYTEYAAIFTMALVVIRNKYIKNSQNKNRIILIYLMHILFITPLFHSSFSSVSSLFYFGMVFSFFSFLPFSVSRIFLVLSCLCFTTGVSSISSANGFIISLLAGFYVIDRNLNRGEIRNRLLVSLLNILWSIFIDRFYPVIIWEIFCTIISPISVIFLYQKKHLKQKERKRLKESRKITYLFNVKEINQTNQPD